MQIQTPQSHVRSLAQNTDLILFRVITLIISTTKSFINVKLEVVVNYELITQLVGFGAGIKILSPQSLANHIASIFQKGVELYISKDADEPGSLTSRQ